MHNTTELARSGELQERVTIVFLVLAWVFILLRTWTRTFIISNFGWDDTTMILAGMIFTVYCAVSLYIEANGGGTHITSIPHLQLLTKWVVVSEALYVAAMMTMKISLGIFFARIIIKRWHFTLIYITMGVNILSSLASFFYCLFRCGPDLDEYVIQQISQKCTPHSLDLFMAYQQAGFNTMTDMVFVTLPIVILWNANMDRKSKISVGFILCLGALGCICSVIRFRYVDGLTQTGDFFWNAVNIAIWSTIEAGASIIAGCLAILRPLLKRVIGQTRGTSPLSGCIKQVSRSLRSGSKSKSSSNASSAPLSNTVTSNHKFERNRRATTDPGTREDPSFVEFLSWPGEEIIRLDSEPGRERKSTDLILGQPTHEIYEDGQRDDRKRQTMHASYTLQRGVGTFGRSMSAPTVPSLYQQGDAV